MIKMHHIHDCQGAPPVPSPLQSCVCVFSGRQHHGLGQGWQHIAATVQASCNKQCRVGRMRKSCWLMVHMPLLRLLPLVQLHLGLPPAWAEVVVGPSMPRTKQKRWWLGGSSRRLAAAACRQVPPLGRIRKPACQRSMRRILGPFPDSAAARARGPKPRARLPCEPTAKGWTGGHIPCMQPAGTAQCSAQLGNSKQCMWLLNETVCSTHCRHDSERPPAACGQLEACVQETQ